MGEIRIQPDPAIEGQPVTITVPDGGTWYVSVDGSGAVSAVTADANNQIEITLSGRGGETFSVTDAKMPPTNASFDIASLSSP